MLIEILVVLCVLAGVFFMFVASVGVLRLSDFYSRTHAPTKAATLGLIFLLLAVVLVLWEAVVVTKAVLAVLFIGATNPVGAHILARAAYRNHVPQAEDAELDEYAPVVAERKRNPAYHEPEHVQDLDVDDLEHTR